MKITYKQLLEGILPLRKLAEEISKPQVSVALAQALQEVEPQIELYVAEEGKVLRRYSKENGNGATMVANKDREALESDIKELKASPVSLHRVGRFRLKTLTDAGATVSGDTLYKLGWMIKTDEEPAWDEMPVNGADPAQVHPVGTEG